MILLFGVQEFKKRIPPCLQKVRKRLEEACTGILGSFLTLFAADVHFSYKDHDCFEHEQARDGLCRSTNKQ